MSWTHRHQSDLGGTMKAEEGNSGPSIYEWLKNPSSWISLSAAIISAISFWLVYLDTGAIKVLLPHRIGIGISIGSWDLDILVPATFYNTGAPPTRRDIERITGRLHSLDKSVPLDGTVEWTYEDKFVGHDEFFRTYPTKKDTGDPDYVEYQGRATSFSLRGNESSTKIMELEMARTHIAVAPSEFQIEVILHTTERAEFKDTSTYECPKNKLTEPIGEATWCQAVVH